MTDTTSGADWRDSRASLVRGGLIALAVALALLVAFDQFHTPSAQPASTEATEFSSVRAMEHVEAIGWEPRPQGSESATAARDYIVGQLEALGLDAEIQTSTAARTTAGTDAIFGATVVNVMARIPGTGSATADGPNKAIVLSAHYDSGPNALGAGDCGACVAAVLESARALLAGAPLRNDVILLFPDGEETQLFGSRAFVQEHPWAQDVAFALNLEAQGTNGPAVLYVTSAGDERITEKVVEYAEQPLTWSFLSTLVRNLVGGSDLDSFTDAGIAGAGVAFFESEQYYHTRLDSPAQLDPGSLQHLGGYALDVARGLGDEDLETLDASRDGLSLTLWRGMVVRYPVFLAWALAVVATLGLAGVLVLGHRRGQLSLRRTATATGLLVAALLVSVLVTTLIWVVVRMLTEAYHVFLIGVTYDADAFVLAFSALTISIFLGVGTWARQRMGWLELAAGAVGLWWLLAALTSIFLPSFSPLFIWPLLAGLGVLGLAVLRPAIASTDWARAAGFTVVLVPTVLLMVPAALLFQTLGGRLEALSLMPMMGLPILWVGLAVALLLPFLPLPTFRRSWLLPAAVGGLAMVMVGWTAGTAGFDGSHPKPNMIMYDLDADSGTARWLTTADAGLGRGRSGQVDEWTSQFLGPDPEAVEVAGWSAGVEFTTAGYQAIAPAAELSPPLIEVVAEAAVPQGRQFTLRVSSPRGATNVRMHVETQLVAARVNGTEADVGELDQGSGLWLHYLALPPEGVELILTFATSDEPISIDVHDWSQGLPDLEGFEADPRPDHMMSSAHDLADTTMVRKRYELQ